MPAKGILGWIVGDDLFTCQIVKNVKPLACFGWQLMAGL